eukprot:1313353-Alexandrium_andersonii.AAC.1
MCIRDRLEPAGRCLQRCYTLVVMHWALAEVCTPGGPTSVYESAAPKERRSGLPPLRSRGPTGPWSP